MTVTADIHLLRDRVAEVLGRHGLELWQLVLVPSGNDPGQLDLQVVGGLAHDDTSTADGFDEVIASAAQAEADQRAQASVEELTERLRRQGGFLDPP